MDSDFRRRMFKISPYDASIVLQNSGIMCDLSWSEVHSRIILTYISP